MRHAFTMIELIFVIVILGILVAVAVPRLSATRNDAIASTVAINLGECVEFAGSAFLMDQSFDVGSDACNDVMVTNPCFTVTPNDAVGTLLVKDAGGAIAGSICLAAQTLAGKANTSSALGVTHQF